MKCSNFEHVFASQFKATHLSPIEIKTGFSQKSNEIKSVSSLKTFSIEVHFFDFVIIITVATFLFLLGGLFSEEEFKKTEPNPFRSP